MPGNSKQKRILVVRTDRIGDVIFITPSLRELRRTFPDAVIATLTQPHTAKVIANNPNVDLILTDDLKKENFWKVVKELKKHKFTHALLMQPTERAAYQLFFARIPYRVGVGHKLYEVITFMKSVSRHNYNPLRHEADYCIDLARKIGVLSDNLTLEIFLTEKEKHEAKDWLKEKNIQTNSNKIFIHTGSLGSAPNWSEVKYLSLIKKLTLLFSTHQYKIFLTAREMSSHFRNNINELKNENIIDIADQISDLRMMIKVISQADLFISPSTGPLHIADALGIKCIGIHCHRKVSSAKHQGILNNVSINLEVSEKNCLKYCSADQNTCGIEKGLSEDEVIQAAKTLLNI